MSKDNNKYSWSYRVGLKQFIAAYRARPCLWRVRHRHYYNKEKRSEALDVLVEKLQLVEPNATRHDVLRKINSLRSVYKKEHRKVLEARQAGEERVVSLWCYPLMRFIDQRLQKEGEVKDEGEVEEEEEEPSGEVIFIKEDVEDEGNESNEYNSFEVLEETLEETMEETLEETMEETLEDEEEIEIPAKRPKLEYEQSEASHSMTESKIEDCHDAYCRSIAYKLRGMGREQRLLAEKLMNEVLFEAESGALTRQHRLERYPAASGTILWSHLTRDQEKKTPTNSFSKSKTTK